MHTLKPRIIGLLGGSFNPAHAGHVFISEQARKQLGLDEVWWLVSPQNPFKPREGMAPFAERVAGAKALTHRHRFIHVSDFEAEQGLQYTADTLRALKTAYPRHQFIWLMGADNLTHFHTWQDAGWIIHNTAIAVYDRAPWQLKARLSPTARFMRNYRKNPSILAASHAPAIAFLTGKRHPLSATFIRNLFGQKSPNKA